MELSFTLVPLVAFLIAIVDFTMPIFLRSTFSHAVREGVRYGITYQTVPGKTQTESIQDVVMLHSMGFLQGQSGRDRIKVNYYSPTTFANQVGSGRNARGNIVEVSVEGYSWNWMVPLMRSNTPLTVQAASSDRLEQPPRTFVLPAP